MAPAALEWPEWPDWRDGDAYAWLRDAGRWTFAWEWLRRSAAYRTAITRDGDAGAFGLVAFEDASHDARTARPLWSACHAAGVLIGQIGAFGDERFDLAAFASLARVHSVGGIEHVLLSDGLRAVRLNIAGGSLLAGPASLRWSITGVREAMPAALSLRRLAALAEHGVLAGALWPREVRAPRWIETLRVHDALAAGASYRDIATIFFGAAADVPRWRVATPSLRLRIQRLAVAARASCAAGPFPWLCVPGADGEPRRRSC